jgi:hypothetical protein
MFFKYGATSSLLSMPFGSSQKMMTTTNDDDNATMNVNIEDQDANFTFRFYSCSKCGYRRRNQLLLRSQKKRMQSKSLFSTLIVYFSDNFPKCHYLSYIDKIL